jgi:DUF2971 family protein
MILDRFYRPAHDELIYHYCGPEAFLNIVKTQTMWFSALFSMNDYLEQQWGLLAFEKAASQIAKEIDDAFLEKTRTLINLGYSSSLLMISSYSLDGDVLSQWRAYSNDGRGFAIGFLAREMVEMPVKPLRVLYDEEEQIRELAGNLRHTFEYEKSIGFKYDQQFGDHWFQIGLDLCAYKNPAFEEEKEIRLGHAVGVRKQGTSLKIVPVAGLAWGKRYKPGNIQFRLRDELIVPYIALDFSNQGKASPIKEVVLAPRNTNSELNVGTFLDTLGIKGVHVRKSLASYW